MPRPTRRRRRHTYWMWNDDTDQWVEITRQMAEQLRKKLPASRLRTHTSLTRPTKKPKRKVTKRPTKKRTMLSG